MVSHRQKVMVLREEARNQTQRSIDLFNTVEHLQGLLASELLKLSRVVKGELIVRVPFGIRQHLIKVNLGLRGAMRCRSIVTKAAELFPQ